MFNTIYPFCFIKIIRELLCIFLHQKGIVHISHLDIFFQMRPSQSNGIEIRVLYRKKQNSVLFSCFFAISTISYSGLGLCFLDITATSTFFKAMKSLTEFYFLIWLLLGISHSTNSYFVKITHTGFVTLVKLYDKLLYSKQQQNL